MRQINYQVKIFKSPPNTSFFLINVKFACNTRNAPRPFYIKLVCHQGQWSVLLDAGRRRLLDIAVLRSCFKQLIYLNQVSCASSLAATRLPACFQGGVQCFAGCGLRPCYLRFRMRYAVWALINCGLECGLRFKEHSTGCGFPRLFCPVCGFTENFMYAGCSLRDFLCRCTVLARR